MAKRSSLFGPQALSLLFGLSQRLWDGSFERSGGIGMNDASKKDHMIKIYITASFRDAHKASMLSDFLEATYCVQTTCKWWQTPLNLEFPKEGDVKSIDDMTRSVLAADIVVCLLPGGRSAHIELGMAIAANKSIVLIGTHQNGDSPYYMLDGIDRMPSIPDFLQKLARLSAYAKSQAEAQKSIQDFLKSLENF